MTTLSVGEFKARFSEMLKIVQAGETVGVCYGKRNELVAVLAPPALVAGLKGIKLGLLQGKVSVKILPDYITPDEEFLTS